MFGMTVDAGVLPSLKNKTIDNDNNIFQLNELSWFSGLCLSRMIHYRVSLMDKLLITGESGDLLHFRINTSLMNFYG